MERTLIQTHASSIVRGLSERAKSLKQLNHKLTKGELRELFVSSVLKRFLSSQFEVGTGIIVNPKGDQSHQLDIVIYDNRIIPPFIREQHLGVYPAESVLATIEVKSRLTEPELMNAEKSARHLKDVIYNPANFYYHEAPPSYYDLFCSVIGFYGNGTKALTEKPEGLSWIKSNIRALYAICLINRYSWITVQDEWRMKKSDPITNEETKRFIAVLLDNVRTIAEWRIQVSRQLHRDYLGIYTRDQNLFR